MSNQPSPEQRQIEVVYALPERQFIIPLVVEAGTVIEQAIIASGLLQQCKEIDLSVNRVGIFSRLAKLSDEVHDGDRIEIYRPLLADPKEIRRRRAERSKQLAKESSQS